MSDRAARFHPTDRDDADDPRSPGRHDRDRILYSSAFRRLSGVTQVLSATDRHPIHNRLTHTLEVAQIARSVAERLLGTERDRALAASLGGLDPDVVEAAALAHDLGHPPFGHAAEQELNRLVTAAAPGAGGFEGNAQTFRIVTTLAVRHLDVPGLNLTRATLCAVLKYPWLRAETGDQARKWGAYASEAPEFAWARQLLPDREGARSPEAELMDWADDVAYAVHDVDDFYRAGAIPLDRLATDAAERAWFVEAELRRADKRSAYDPGALAQAFNELMRLSPIFDPYRGGREGRARLRSFTSSLIGRYVKAVSLAEGTGGTAELRIDPDARMEVAMLEGLTWQYVIESGALVTQRYGHRRLIASLFDVLCQAGADAAGRKVFPQFYRERLGHSPSDERLARTVADFVASMTEAQAIELHHRLTGISLAAALDPVVP